MLDVIINIFFNTALDAFRFLSVKYGYRLTDTRLFAAEGAMVRYESDHAYLEVWYDALRGGELSVVFGLLGKRDVSLHFEHSFCATSATALEYCIHRLADQVADEATPLLRGDIEAYHQRQRELEKRDRDWANEMRLKAIRAKVTEAWHNNHYAHVVTLLASMQDNISLLEIKKLDYARNILKKSV